LLAFVVRKIDATGCFIGNLRIQRHLDAEGVGQLHKQTWPDKKSVVREEAILIESQVADFRAQKNVVNDCRRDGKGDFNGVFCRHVPSVRVNAGA
jgi:hypothetical protein